MNAHHPPSPKQAKQKKPPNNNNPTYSKAPTATKLNSRTLDFLSARAEKLNGPAMDGRSFSASQETVCN